MGNKLNQMRVKDPSQILADLNSRENINGALYCSPETFAMIYDLEKRRSQRQSYPAVIVHLSLEFAKDDFKEDPGSKVLEFLKSNLRSGDILCRWSREHFIMLLVDIEEKEVEEVLIRLRDNFMEKYNINPEDIIEILKNINKNADLIYIEKAFHFPMESHPVKVNSILIDWLNAQ